MHKPLLLALILLFATVTCAMASTPTLTIGVLAYRGEQAANTYWSPTAEYLARMVPKYDFVIAPFESLHALRRAIERNGLDFVLTNPGHYVQLQASAGIDALATLNNNNQGVANSVLGSVIFARADHSDLQQIYDLKGKSFMAVDKDAFGGFQIAWREMKMHGLDPFHDFSRLVFSGFPHDKIVYAVRDGKVDAGTVRSGVLESMARAGQIRLDDFRIVHALNTPDFPYAHSTRLYPEWAFAKTGRVPAELANRVALALFNMPADDPAALAGGYAGWTVPLDYRPVRDLLTELGIEPYQNLSLLSPRAALRAYWQWLLPAALALLGMVVITFYVLELNRRLRQSQLSLRNQICARERTQNLLSQSNDALRTLHGITARQDLDSEHKIRALLNAGCEKFGLPIGILCRIYESCYEVVEAIAPDNVIVKGMIMPLDMTYCSATVASTEPVGFARAADSEWATHPAYVQSGFEAYFGIRVCVEHRVYGTLHFVDRTPRTEPFTDTEREVLKLMAQWMGAELQREHTSAEMGKLSSALQQSADLVIITDRHGIIEYVNPAFERITGFSRDEVIGNTPGLLRSDNHDAEFYASMWSTILSSEVFRATMTNRRKDGSLYYEEKTITPLKDGHGEVAYFVSTGKDITDRALAETRVRQHEAQLAHVSRVSTMGAMASALAHELNQPLSAIVNYARGCVRRLQHSMAQPAELHAALEQICTQSERAAEIIRRLRGFMSRSTPERIRVNINTIVHEAVQLATPEARRMKTVLHLDLSDDLEPVMADVIQIEQVILNLICNALEEMHGADIRRREVILRTRPDPNGRVEVTVLDSGPGVAAGKQESIFEPFFTTKKKGMGMGLFISRSIVEAHGGHLCVDANPDGGAAFRFTLGYALQATA